MPETDYNTLELERQERKKYLVDQLMAYCWDELTLEELDDVAFLLELKE